MSNPLVPPLPVPDRDDAAAEPDASMIDDDGEQTLDPDVDDDLIDSAEADRLATGADDADSV